MRLLVRYPDGSLQAAILVAVLGGHLRVSIPGCGDAVGLTWAGGEWLADSGDAVQVRFDVAPEEFSRSVRHGARISAQAPCPQPPEPWTIHGLQAAFVN